jgi:LysR family transcriptional regulator, nitrogen assimilation regulatory protein
MNFHLWRLFLDAADHGSLSKVAVLHGTSQPHISRQIQELEQQCGARLFERTGRGVALTALGQRIAPKVRIWLTGTEQLDHEIRSTAGQTMGRVRLGTLPSLAHPFVSTLFARLNARHPLLQLSVREGQGAQLETWLDDGSLDLALLFRHGQPNGSDALSLAEAETFLIGPVGDPVTARATIKFKALDGLPLVTFCRPSTWREQLEHLARERSVRLNVVLEADSLALQLGIASQGGAYALLGSYAIEVARSQHRFQAARLVDPPIVRHIALAVARAGQISPATRAVMQEAQALAAETSLSARPQNGRAP